MRVDEEVCIEDNRIHKNNCDRHDSGDDYIAWLINRVQSKADE